MRTKIEILENIKDLYQLKTDTALAKFLGIASTTLSSWKSRDSLDYDLVFAKCVGVDLNALINGEKMNGQNERAKSTGISYNLNGQNDGQLKNEEPDWSDAKFNADFSATTTNKPSQECQACIEKDNTIVALWELIKAKSEIIKAKDEVIASKDEIIKSKNEQIDDLIEKGDDDFDLDDMPVSSVS